VRDAALQPNQIARAALGRGNRGDNRDLAAELVGSSGLAIANALHLGRVQRVDLGPALALLLMANPQRDIEQRSKAVLKCAIAFDLAADIADDAAEPGAQELQLPPGARMDVAPHHDAARLATRK
jgi:hypothetical protein